ncbi:MAG: hypothetical protein KDK78_03060 [Chlamydiia bacterium]|nr:hypothetical protein [Chlamydiia bacterium]
MYARSDYSLPIQTSELGFIQIIHHSHPPIREMTQLDTKDVILLNMERIEACRHRLLQEARVAVFSKPGWEAVNAAIEEDEDVLCFLARKLRTVAQ